MKLAECIQHINQVLNFPSFAYTDMSHFFDQAIAELNTTLRVDIPLVSDMISQLRTDYLGSPDAIALDAMPDVNIPINLDSSPYWYSTGDGKFHVYGSDTVHDKLYGVYMPDFETRHVFQTAVFSDGMVVWVLVDVNALPDIDLSIWLPDEWVVLFVIPYVCSKCSARDGGDSALYVEEYTQGFQQLQTSYRVPNTVELARVAGKEAYTPDVKRAIADGTLNTVVRTKAIYPEMKINTVENAVYGGMYENGGWGL